jgi:chemotaxis signal transduction protein
VHVVLFTSDDQAFAISTRCIVEVIPAVQWRPLPASEIWLKGLFTYRATLLPLLDFDLLLQRESPPLRRTARILVIRSGDPCSVEASSAELGLLVQRVLGSEQLDVTEADTRAAARRAESMPSGQSRLESGGSDTGTDAPLALGTHLTDSHGSDVAAKSHPRGSLNLPSLLGPVVLTPTGMIQLIRADGLPIPKLS